MEEKVLARIRELMLTQSDIARREVELTNVPVVVAQAERPPAIRLLEQRALDRLRVQFQSLDVFSLAQLADEANHGG